LNPARERELLERLQAPPAGSFAAVNGIELYYEVHGAGEPLLLLHGFTQTGRAWDVYLDSFRDGYQLIVPDLRGHGRSTNPSNAFTHRQSAEDVAVLLDLLGIDRCRAIGFSTGGMTLIHLATSRPERLERMVIIAATSYYPEQARAIMRDLDPARLRDEANDELREMHWWGEEQVQALRRQFHAFKDSYGI
jgi:pimeloyl-ACP methyl ester carboxylesterase